MDRSDLCGCKGYRTCLICEKTCNLGFATQSLNLEEHTTYVYCPLCSLAWPGLHLDDYKTHPNHEGTPISYPGVYVDLNFLTEEKENFLIGNIDEQPWDLSQSGRRKQNYGPKCNFKKRKLRLDNFNGFPIYSQFLQDKFKDVSVLRNFQTIEQCSLEYDPERGASIDPHIDDCWIWGERIVTVNLLSDSMLTMTYNKKCGSYNLDCVKQYYSIMDVNKEPFQIEEFEEGVNYPVVRIPMPRRSLLVLYGSARYDWEHRVLREDVLERRVCIAYREFTPTYLPDGEKYNEAEDIFSNAKLFW